MSQGSLVAACGIVAGLLLWFGRTTSGARWVVPLGLLVGTSFGLAPDHSMRGMMLVSWGIAVVLGIGLWIGARPQPRFVSAAFAALAATALADAARYRDSLPRDSGHPLVASYPFESMAPRLAYESHHPGSPPVAGFS